MPRNPAVPVPSGAASSPAQPADRAVWAQTAPARRTRTPRRSRSRLTLPVVVLATLTTILLGGCGSTTPAGDAKAGFDAVAISGSLGSAPDVTWKSQMDVAAKDAQTRTLIKGDGAALTTGQKVLVNWWAGDGYTKKEVFDTFGATAAGFELTVGTPATQASTVEDLVATYLSTKIPAGTTIGSRLAFTANSADVFGNNVYAPQVAQADIGNSDGMVLVADILPTTILSHPDGTHPKLPAWAPKPTLNGYKVTALDFKGTTKPDGKLRKTFYTLGTGPRVQKGDVIVANYFGEVYGASKAFDQSYDRGTFTTGIGLGQVVPGWDKALVGVPVGSRVILSVPPALGYGKKGNSQAGIKGTDTLVFVIDVLGTA